MSFLDLARHRFSVRKYKPDPVPDEDLNYILEAGRIAPSAVNYQPWHFLVIKEKEIREKTNELYHREWFRMAPVVIILIGDHKQGWKRNDGKDHTDIDIAIAADHITLAASERGLGTCWVCNFDKQKTMKMFNFPDHFEPVVFLPLGFPDEESNVDRHDSKRKKLSEIVSYDRFNPDYV